MRWPSGPNAPYIDPVVIAGSACSGAACERRSTKTIAHALAHDTAHFMAVHTARSLFGKNPSPCRLQRSTQHRSSTPTISEKLRNRLEVVPLENHFVMNVLNVRSPPIAMDGGLPGDAA
jgi:hypothetical protein